MGITTHQYRATRKVSASSWLRFSLQHSVHRHTILNHSPVGHGYQPPACEGPTGGQHLAIPRPVTRDHTNPRLKSPPSPHCGPLCKAKPIHQPGRCEPGAAPPPPPPAGVGRPFTIFSFSFFLFLFYFLFLFLFSIFLLLLLTSWWFKNVKFEKCSNLENIQNLKVFKFWTMFSF
jgi:hypothetical protein